MMVRNIAELFKEFLIFEQEKVDTFEMPHMPTLGEAYEEITIQGLNQKYILPNIYNLKVVKGFIKIGEKQLPQQIDCMLVHGEGIQFGLTDKYIYDISNVLAIFEVKKNLTKDQLLDALAHLSELRIEFYSYIDSLIKSNSLNISMDLFSQHLSYLIGFRLESVEQIKFLEENHQFVAMTLLVEMLMPLTIIHSYEGYSRIGDLRNAIKDIVEFLDEKNQNRGVRILDFPSLITNNKLGVLKAIGLPYWLDYSKDREKGCSWGYMCSYNHNSSVIFLEMLWAKISQKLNIEFDYGEDLINENIFPLVAIDIEKGKTEISFISYNDNNFKSLKKSGDSNFQPRKIDEKLVELFNIITMIGGVEKKDPLISEYLQSSNQDLNQLLSLISGYLCMGISEEAITPISSWKCVKINDELWISHDLVRFNNWLTLNNQNYEDMYMTIWVQ